MKRSRLRRRTPLRTTSSLARKSRPKQGKPLRKRGRKHAKKMKQNYGEQYAEHVRKRPCDACLFEARLVDQGFEVETADLQGIAAHTVQKQGECGHWWHMSSLCPAHEFLEFHVDDKGAEYMQKRYGWTFREKAGECLEEFFEKHGVLICGDALLDSLDEEVMHTGRVPLVDEVLARFKEAA